MAKDTMAPKTIRVTRCGLRKTLSNFAKHAARRYIPQFQIIIRHNAITWQKEGLKGSQSQPICTIQTHSWIEQPDLFKQSIAIVAIEKAIEEYNRALEN